MVDPKEVGERIRALRKVRGLTQQDLAHAVSARVMTISDWENGRVRTHDQQILNEVAVVLDADPAFLRYGDGAHDVALDVPSWRDWCASDEGSEATEPERAILNAAGIAAAGEGYALTPGVYSAWLVALRMFGRPPTKR